MHQFHRDRHGHRVHNGSPECLGAEHGQRRPDRLAGVAVTGRAAGVPPTEVVASHPTHGGGQRVYRRAQRRVDHVPATRQDFGGGAGLRDHVDVNHSLGHGANIRTADVPIPVGSANPCPARDRISSVSP